uniref:Protein TIC 21, chloroplastic n=1 Tax=Opuntia streptacantha TaxID=393608 RepID=A0A7C9AES3_OPUST
MQTLLSPAVVATCSRLPKRMSSCRCIVNGFLSPPSPLIFRLVSSSSSAASFCWFDSPSTNAMMRSVRVLPPVASSPDSAGFASSFDESDQAKLAQVAKRLENTARYFKRLGTFAFWGQLVCTVVAAVILSFSIVVTGKISSPASFYATAGGIAAAFISVFWAFGYLRLSEKLRRTANEPSKAPPRAEVVKSLRNGIIVNLLGMGAAILGMQATVGSLVAKALTTSATPYYQAAAPVSSPVLPLDVFLVQASANTILSHFFGLVSSLELLRSVTLQPAQGTPSAKMA